MSEAIFPAIVEFSDAGALAAVLWLQRGPPYLFRFVITDAAVRIEGRGRVLRRIFASRTCDIDHIVSARLRGTLVILSLPNDEWWTISSMTKCRQIIAELTSCGVAVTEDP